MATALLQKFNKAENRQLLRKQKEEAKRLRWAEQDKWLTGPAPKYSVFGANRQDANDLIERLRLQEGMLVDRNAQIGLLQGQVQLLTDQYRAANASVRDLTDRYHEAETAASHLRDQVADQEGRIHYLESFMIVERTKFQIIRNLAKVQDSLAETEADECAVCSENKKAIVLGCGHFQLCALCTGKIITEKNVCPACSEPIKSATKLFM